MITYDNTSVFACHRRQLKALEHAHRPLHVCEDWERIPLGPHSTSRHRGPHPLRRRMRRTKTQRTVAQQTRAASLSRSRERTTLHLRNSREGPTAMTPAATMTQQRCHHKRRRSLQQARCEETSIMMTLRPRSSRKARRRRRGRTTWRRHSASARRRCAHGWPCAQKLPVLLLAWLACMSQSILETRLQYCAAQEPRPGSSSGRPAR